MIQDHKNLHDRLALLWIFTAAGGVVLGLRLVHLQVIRNVEYELAAERNRSQLIYQAAPRGRFYDRNGVALATSQPAFSLIYLPGKGRDKAGLESLASELARHLNRDPAELLETLKQAQREEAALRLAENIPAKAMFKLSELKTIYPGVELVVEARRYYPYGRFASHLLGYMGKMDPRSWKELKGRGYRADSRVGRMGLEQAFEAELRGRDGGLRMEVDAQGRLKRILERIPWEAGSNIHLTLDLATQKAADEGLRRSLTGRGAVIALDPRSGAIRALSSAPDFDPNALLSTDPEEFKAATQDLPEFNSAISGTYPPGSTFKIVTGAAGLNEGRFDTEESVACPGYFELGKKIFLCWEAKGHKKVAWLTALQNSCDVYFYKMGLKTGGASIEKYAKAFGLGAKTNIALKGEKAGHLFGPTARAARQAGWYDGDTVNLAIGQGELLVTPIQMAVLAAAVANRGTLWRPYYTSRIEYVGGLPEYVQKPEALGEVHLQEAVWNDLHRALALVVSSGTGRAAIIPGLEVRGKTGTSQNPHGADHAWFVAFANRPGELSELAVSVLVEFGEHGSSSAAPIAREVIKAYYGITDKRPAAVSRSTGTLAAPLPARPAPMPSPHGAPR